MMSLNLLAESQRKNKEVASKLLNFLEGADISIDAVEAESRTSSFGNDDNKIHWSLERESALFSDFKIVIVTHSDEAEISLLQKEAVHDEPPQKRPKTLKETVYFVHKFAIAGGQHKSEYFSKLFASGMTESTSSESRIVLDSPVVADEFGTFLDFLYFEYSNVNPDIQIDESNVVQLRWLSSYFIVRSLSQRTNRFLAYNLNSSNANKYIVRTLNILQSQPDTISETDERDKLIAAAIEECAKNFDTTAEANFEELNEDVLEAIVTSPNFNADSKKYSDRLLDYLSVANRLHMINEENKYFQQLACCKVMPHLSFRCSIFFLDTFRTVNDKYGGKCYCKANASLSLRERCKRSVAMAYDELAGDSDQLSKFPVTLQNTLLQAALTRSTDRLHSIAKNYSVICKSLGFFDTNMVDAGNGSLFIISKAGKSLLIQLGSKKNRIHLNNTVFYLTGVFQKLSVSFLGKENSPNQLHVELGYNQTFKCWTISAVADTSWNRKCHIFLRSNEAEEEVTRKSMPPRTGWRTCLDGYLKGNVGEPFTDFSLNF